MNLDEGGGGKVCYRPMRSAMYGTDMAFVATFLRILVPVYDAIGLHMWGVVLCGVRSRDLV
eukprot:3941188-Rhodomonas_salina.4